MNQTILVLSLGICVSCNKTLDEQTENNTSINLKSTSNELNLGTWETISTSFGSADDYDFLIGKFTSDDTDDLIRVSEDNGKAYLIKADNEFSSWNYQCKYGETTKNEFHSGDFDGDGISDVFKSGRDGKGWINYGRDGLDDYWDWHKTSFGKCSHNGFIIGDFDGDGLDDIMKIGKSDGIANVAYADETFATYHKLRKYGITKSNKYKTGDFDGDGYTDVLKVGSDGKGWINYATDGLSDYWDWNKSSFGAKACAYLIGDFDLDGKDDIIKVDNDSTEGTAYIAYASEEFSTWNYISAFGLIDSNTYYTGDFNGDGNVDVLKISSAGKAYVSYN